MRFNLLSLLLLVTVVALAIVLLLKRKPDKMLLIGGEVETYELQESAGENCQWLDKTLPPELSVADAFQISQAICSHLDSQREKTGFGFWETESISLERLGKQKWAYFVRLEGGEYPQHLGINMVEQTTCMILFDGSAVFDSGSCTETLSRALETFPDIIDGAPVVNDRPDPGIGGGFF